MQKMSEDRLRRFMADASHELRTPLAAIRGYAELFRIGAVTDKEQVSHVMAQIEAEAQRMGAVVEDLLALARVTEGGGEMRHEVDLAPIVHGLVEELRVSAPERVIAYAATEVPLVAGDPDQLRRAVSELLNNAVIHTPASAGITVTLSRNQASVELEIADEGPGLPTEDPSQLFEDFWRPETGRERGRAGSGLGLALVAAIVSRHRGTISAQNNPTGGALFTVMLTADYSAGSQG